MKSVLPLFSPTEVILIDDDASMLKEWNIKLRSLSVVLKVFENPFEALDYINSSFKKLDEIMDLSALYRQIYSPQRFKQISTIIVDYDMPGMNGLEVCRQITSPHIQKIVLTGAATSDIAINAFNEGIIHQFFQKDDLNVFAKLQNAVVAAQERYIERCTFELMHSLQNECPETEILQDSAFRTFFESLVREKNITEYYLLDSMGSFLFLSERGEASALFVFNEEALESKEDMISESGRNTALAHEVYAKKQAICFYPFNRQEKYEPANWKSYLQPLKRLESGSSLFYAFVPDLINFDQSKMISFKDYLCNLEK